MVSVSSVRLVTRLVRLTVGDFVHVGDGERVQCRVVRRAGDAASSTWTVTSKLAFVSKSRAVPAFRRSSVPTISKLAASAPVSVRSFVPRASSVITMSAILMAVDGIGILGQIVDQVGQADRRGFVHVGDGQRVQLPCHPACRRCRVVDLDGDVEAGFRLEVQSGAGLAGAARADDLEAGGIGAGQGQVVRAQGIVGDHDVGDLDGR